MKIYAVETSRNEDNSLVEYASPLAIFYRTREQAEAFIEEYEQTEPDWQEDKKKFHHIVSEIEVASPVGLMPYDKECKIVADAIKDAFHDFLRPGTIEYKDAAVTAVAMALAEVYYKEHKRDNGHLSDILRGPLSELEYEIKRQYIKLAEAECEEVSHVTE